MNLLAHLHLGGDLSPLRAAGNLTADFCREMGPDEFRMGVHLHRRIDSYTDTHPVVASARRLFDGELSRFASVLSDIVFDFCLARSWDAWSPQESRVAFIDRQLAAMLKVSAELPSAATRVICAMRDERWMHGYDERAGMEATVSRIARWRPRFAAILEAPGVMVDHYEAFHDRFQEFYPDLVAHARASPTTPSSGA